ncbi:MAG TPA: septum formation initiator family protein [Gemmatimonadaceae bacterium]
MAKARRVSGSEGKQALVKRILVALGVVAALYFAVQGGEYRSTDLLRQKQRRAALMATNRSLQRVVDSLQRYKRQLQTDPALQERIAREEFGMVRGNKELLYRFAEPASDTLHAP